MIAQGLSWLLERAHTTKTDLSQAVQHLLREEDEHHRAVQELLRRQRAGRGED